MFLLSKLKKSMATEHDAYVILLRGEEFERAIREHGPTVHTTFVTLLK